MNIAYLGTAAFAVPTLTRLFEEGFTISGVVTQPDKPSGRGQTLQAPPVKRKAAELHLPVYQPVTLKDAAALTLFTALQPDLMVVVAYGKILPLRLLQIPRFGAINLHGSLLPKYRGAAPIQWAVANGELETGVCTMQVEEGLDTGPVYLCETTVIKSDETVPQLSDRLADLGKELMLRTIQGILKGTLVARPQNNDQATYAPIIKKSHGFIDWKASASEIHNRVRAFNGWPGAVTRFRDTVCKILKTKVSDRKPALPGLPGTIILDKRVLCVSCGKGEILEVLELQPENRKPVSGGDFANGAHLQAGEKFELMTDNG